MSMVLNSLEILAQNDTMDSVSAGAGTEIMRVDSNGLVMAAGYDIKQGSTIYHDRMIITEQILATTVDHHIFVADAGNWKLDSAYYLPRVAGSDGGAVTLDLKVCIGVVAPASGTTQLDATLNLKGTADTLQSADLIAAPTTITQGSSLAVDVTGTLTAAVGLLQVCLIRVS